MNALLWFGAVVFSCGWLFTIPIFARPDPSWAAGCFVVGLTLLGVARRGRGGLVTQLLVLLAMCAAQLTVTPLFYWIGSRYHRLDLLSPVIQGALSLFGLESNCIDGVVYVHHPRYLLPFTTTWEKLGLLPATWIILAVSVLLAASHREKIIKALLTVTSVTAGFLIIRYLILIAVVLQLDDPRNVQASFMSGVRIFKDPLIQAVSLLPLAWLYAIFVPWKRCDIRVCQPRDLLKGRAIAAVALVFLGTSSVVGYFQYQDPGQLKAGRILIDDAHSSDWEVASKPLTTEWYGRESVYNYATMVAFLRQYYDVAIHASGSYTDNILSEADVLILKTATRPFRDTEVDAIQRFVEAGGGVFLIGDHTNLLGMSTNMNKVAQRFRFSYHLDAANRLDDGGFHTFAPATLFPHPATVHLPSFEFMTSCTLSAPLAAENVMIGSNTFSDFRDYSAPSFFGNVTPDTEDDFGVHVLAAAQKLGRGRVLAFTDGTVFSSFAVLSKGRPEFLLGVMQYLNRKNVSSNRVNTLLGILGMLALLGAGLLVVRQPWARQWLAMALPLSAFTAMSLGGVFFAGLISSSYPVPHVKRKARTVALLAGGFDYVLPAAIVANLQPAFRSFDTFFVTLQRLGYIPRVVSLDEAIAQADAIVALNPCEFLRPSDLTQLEKYVRRGGRLLVLDSVQNERSTANQILGPFQLQIVLSDVSSSNRFAEEEWLEAMGRPIVDGKLPHLEFGNLEAAPIYRSFHTPCLSVLGGTALFQEPGGRTLAVTQSAGHGRVVALVDSTMFSRAQMGETTAELHPGDPALGIYELEYRLFSDYLFDGQSTWQPDAGVRVRVGDVAVQNH